MIFKIFLIEKIKITLYTCFYHVIGLLIDFDLAHVLNIVAFFGHAPKDIALHVALASIVHLL